MCRVSPLTSRGQSNTFMRMDSVWAVRFEQFLPEALLYLQLKLYRAAYKGGKYIYIIKLIHNKLS